MPDDFGYEGGNNQDIDSTNLDKNNKDKDKGKDDYEIEM